MGKDPLHHQVRQILAQRRVIAEELRIEQSNLEDAYLALTGDAADSAEMEGK